MQEDVCPWSMILDVKCFCWSRRFIVLFSDFTGDVETLIVLLIIVHFALYLSLNYSFTYL